MPDIFKCAACGRTLRDGETVYRTDRETYCRHCRYLLLKKNREGLALLYRSPAFKTCTCAGCGSEIEEGQMLYLFDAASPVYCSVDEFLQAERGNVVDEFREVVRRDRGGMVPFLSPGRVRLYRASLRQNAGKLWEGEKP